MQFSLVSLLGEPSQVESSQAKPNYEYEWSKQVSACTAESLSGESEPIKKALNNTISRYSLKRQRQRLRRRQTAATARRLGVTRERMGNNNVR